MMEPARNPLEAILRHCAASAPEPWYPSAFARATGTTREILDPALDRLRMAGLIHLTDWLQGVGQGYLLTPEGEHALNHPGELEDLRDPELDGIMTAGPALWPSAPPESRPRNRADRVRPALQNPPRPRVAYALIVINTLVFLAGLLVALQQGVSAQDYFGLNSDGMIPSDPRVMQVQHQFGAIQGIDLLQGQWWRLLACCFVHFGLIHLSVNMWSLYAVGPFLEMCWGRGRFLILYLLTGLAGSCASVLVHPQVEGAGASGAIWGVFASLLPWILLNRKFLSRVRTASLLRNMLVVIVLNVFISMLPGISAAAHFVGGGAGVVAGAALNEQRFGRGVLRWLAGLFVLGLPLLCVGTVVIQIHGRAWKALDFKALREPKAREALDVAKKLNRGLFLAFDQKRLKTPSIDNLRQMVSVAAEIRTQLARAEDAVSRAGPFYDPQVEESRETILQEAERERQLYEDVELDLYLQPAAADALRQTMKAMEPLGEGGSGLRLLGPRTLSPASAAKIVETLSSARQQLIEIVNLFQCAGTYQTPRLEELRQAQLQQLDAESAVLGFTAEFLKKGEDWTESADVEFVRLKRQRTEATNRLRALRHK